MPVIALSLTRLKEYAMNKHSQGKILETLPYLGLDIESMEGDSVNVEYSPNRPDYSSEAGIARSLLGILEVKLGCPEYHFGESEYVVQIVPGDIERVRPHIFGISANIAVNDEVIKQLITMQEDLHNGLGRKRAQVAIGIHNADPISKKIVYRATRDKNYRFVPLGMNRALTIEEIMAKTDQGIRYGKLLRDGIFPILEDSEGKLLSMPPIINGDLTKLRDGVSSLFIDITATEFRAGEATAAIIASMLSDIGAAVRTVKVASSPSSTYTTPEMTPVEMPFDLQLSNSTVGLKLSLDDAARCLARSRIDLRGTPSAARIPRYRADIIHPVDLAEEVALGYGIFNLQPMEMQTSLTGAFNRRLRKLDDVVEIMVGLGLTEIWNLTMISREQATGCLESGKAVRVNDPKSLSFEFARCDLLSSLLGTLGASTDQEYPQRIFELSPVFYKMESARGLTNVVEHQHVAALIAGAEANYTVARSMLESFLRMVTCPPNTTVGIGPLLEAGVDKGIATQFIPGRRAVAMLEASDSTENRKILGVIGEILPSLLEKNGLTVPVSGFELDLEQLLKD